VTEIHLIHTRPAKQEAIFSRAYLAPCSSVNPYDLLYGKSTVKARNVRTA
jgi:hypothetical protein